MDVKEARKFEEVSQEMACHAAAMLPEDLIVTAHELGFTAAQHLLLPDGRQLALTDRCREQLAALLGLSKARWFGWPSPTTAAAEITQRFAVLHGDFRIRAWKDGSGGTTGIARALLPVALQPIEDARIFQRLGQAVASLDDYRFLSIEGSEAVRQVLVLQADGIQQPGMRGMFHPAIALRNSEIGAAAFTLDDCWIRMVHGSWSLWGGKHSIYAADSWVDDVDLDAALVHAFIGLLARSQLGLAAIHRARQTLIRAPRTTLEDILRSPEIQAPLVEMAWQVFMRDVDHSRFGLGESIVFTARVHQNNSEVRFLMEELAGEYLAAS